MEEHIRRLREAKAIAALGGGEDKIAKEHAKGKLSAREHIDLLLTKAALMSLTCWLNTGLGPQEMVL